METLNRQAQAVTNAAAVSFAHLFSVDSVADLQAEVEQLLPQHWVAHVNKNDYQGGWDVLPIRCRAEHVDAHPILQGFAIATGENWQHLPLLDQCPHMLKLLDNIHCPLKAVRLMRLNAGAEIKPHRDEGLGIAFGEARLHLPIHTSDAVSFIVNKKIMPMRAGELWYFNADQIHEVYNCGSEDRINVVIDCVVNDWLREAIMSGTDHE
jgi:hypothetical protein